MLRELIQVDGFSSSKSYYGGVWITSNSHDFHILRKKLFLLRRLQTDISTENKKNKICSIAKPSFTVDE